MFQCVEYYMNVGSFLALLFLMICLREKRIFANNDT
jgi:hypothetical protein